MYLTSEAETLQQGRAGVKVPPLCIACILPSPPLALSLSLPCFLTEHNGIPLVMGGGAYGGEVVPLEPPPCTCASHGQSDPLCQVEGKGQSKGREANGRTQVTAPGCIGGVVIEGLTQNNPPGVKTDWGSGDIQSGGGPKGVWKLKRGW